jgi:alkylation response protein AidB-like acyl-CoA dehydrogenase
VAATREGEIREQVREFLKDGWDAELELVEWRRILCDSGWGMPMWPVEWYGKGLDKELARVVAAEFEAERVPGLTRGGIGAGMAAPTILTHGTDAQRARYIKPILTGEEQWCQLFSEPGAGSDAAGSTTRAERHGDEWIVNGQKVWTSGAQTAKFGLLLARSDWDKPKHEGLSYWIIDMKQPGVEVRPLKQMTGGASFNEVFFVDARVPHENMLDEEGKGWAVAITTLMNERVSIGGGGVNVGIATFATGGRARDAADHQPPMEMRQMMGQRMSPMELAKRNGRNQDPVVRQQLAYLYSLQRVSNWNNQRSRAAAAKGARPGPEGSLAKLSGSRISRVSARLGALVAGPETMVDGPVAQMNLGYHSASIAGGTDDIQRNIIGERVLGLPKDPQVDVNIPFREVKTNQR